MNGTLPPHDENAEQSVIGSLLIDGTAIHKIATFLMSEHFYYDQNRWLYEACFELYRRNEPINQITVAQELARTGKLESCGGAAELSRLVAISPTALDIESYANIVYRLSVNRRLISAGEQITAIGNEAGPDVEDSLGRAESLLFKLRHGQSPRDFTHIRQELDKFFETSAVEPDGLHHEELPYVRSNFTGLDEFFDGGLQRSDLVIVAGRTSMGKTSLALGIARNAAVVQGACVAIFSLEMARDSLVMRLLSNESGVNSRRVRFGQHTDEEEKQVMDAIGALSEAPIYIDDSPMLRVAEMRSKALRLDYDHPIDLIIVDYLQLIAEEGRRENRVQELSYITRSLKGLARELNVPVIAVSQLSRAVEGRPTHIPQLSDLRESGSIEQDADIVLFIYREEYYHPNEEEWRLQFPDKEYPRGEADIIIAKHRNGPTGQVKLKFIHGLAKFDNLPSQQSVGERNLL